MDDTIAPASIPQEQFLASESNITLYSGSAGAGKTFAIILMLLKYMTKPNTTAVVFRRTSTQLRQGGGIWQEATAVFVKIFGKRCLIRDRDLEIRLPEFNSIVKFSHLQYTTDINNHLGAQYSVIVFDEATLFDFDEQILPLMGRLRNARVSYQPVMAWATNPMYNHGIMHWIKDFYLDSEGIPIPERSNVERYFVTQDGKPLWYDDKELAIANHGAAVRSFRAIRAHVTQNIPLLKNNPDYLNNLMALPPIKRKIFLDGSWFSREEEAGYYKRHFSEVVPYPNVLTTRRVRSWDTASTPVSSASQDPDWTRGTLVSRDRHGYITLEDVASLRDRPHKVEELIYQCARNDPEGTIVGLNIDPGSAGLAYVDHIRKRLAEMGIFCKVIRSNKGKLQRFLPFSALSEAGFTKVVKAEWNEDFFEEAERFNGQKNNGHDDICDALALGVEILNQGNTLPDFDPAAFNISAAPSNQSYGFNGVNIHDLNINGASGIPTSGLLLS